MALWPVTWTPQPGTAGIRLRWSVHAPGAAPDYGSPVDVDAALGEYEIETEWPVGQMLSVELVGWTEFSGGAVGGDEGAPTVLRAIRPGGIIAPRDSLAAIACRVVLDDDHALVLDDDHCLVLTDP